MTPWMLAVIALIPALAVPSIAAGRGGTSGRLVALQLATAITTIILALMTFAFDQSAFADLPLTLALLGLPGTLVIALFLERWL